MTKKILYLLVGIFWGASFLNGSIFAETQMQVNGKGEIRQAQSEEVWRSLTEIEEEAIANPGKEFAVGFPIKKNQRTDFFHYSPVRKYGEIVVFDKEKQQLRTLQKTTIKQGEERFAWYIIFLFVGLGAVFYLNYRIERYGVDDKISFFATMITVISVAVASIISINSLVMTLVFAFVVVVFSITMLDGRGYKKYFVLYIVASAVGLFLDYFI